MSRILAGQSIGIPVTEVGDRLQKLNDAITANSMAVAAENDVTIDSYRGKAVSVTLKVYLLNEEGDKNVGA